MLDKVPPEAEDPRHATSRLPVDAKYSSWDFFPSKQRSIGKSQYNCKCIIETLMGHRFDRVFLFVLVRYVSVIDKQPQPNPRQDEENNTMTLFLDVLSSFEIESHASRFFTFVFETDVIGQLVFCCQLVGSERSLK